MRLTEYVSKAFRCIKNIEFGIPIGLAEISPRREIHWLPTRVKVYEYVFNAGKDAYDRVAAAEGYAFLSGSEWEKNEGDDIKLNTHLQDMDPTHVIVLRIKPFALRIKKEYGLLNNVPNAEKFH